jgi:hypothetical protein
MKLFGLDSMKIGWITDSKEEIVFLENLNPALAIDFIKNDEEFSAEFDCILINANYGWNKRSNRIGLKKIQKLRRDFFVTAPIIVYSFESFEEIVRQCSILESKAVKFLRQPFLKEDLITLIHESQNETLSKNDLIEIVNKHCDLTEHWSILIHIISGRLNKKDVYFPEIKQAILRLTESISYFSPELKPSVKNAEKILAAENNPGAEEMRDSLQRLGDAIKGKKIELNWREEFNKLDKAPPKGYSRVLIADDEPVPWLILNLQNEFHYEIVGHATNSYDAENLLKKHKPDIVLSDYYFKRRNSDRKPNEKFGSDFMKTALRFEVGTESNPKKPIVAVISKTSLDPVNQIWAGVVDCSGNGRTEFVHYKIWQEANRRGVFEAEKIGNQELTLNLRCRWRIEPYVEKLPQIIYQWKLFKNTLRETLEEIKNLRCSEKSADWNIINRILQALEPYSKANDFSLNQVESIFSQIAIAHEQAKQLPATKIKSDIRDILHGKIEQFRSVKAGVESALRVIEEVAGDLSDLHDTAENGQKLKRLVETLDFDKNLLPYLDSLNEAVKQTVEILPSLPANPNNFIFKDSEIKKINIISIEDNPYWANIVKNGVEKLKSRLGGLIDIDFTPFDNIADAEDALQKNKNLQDKNDKSKPESHLYLSNSELVKTIAIVDICLPKAKNQKPHRKHGIEFLERLSVYSTNFRKAVFSTKSSLDDILDIGKLGIPNRYFIAKNNNAEDSLIQALATLIEKKEKYIVRSIDDTSRVGFFINNLYIDFADELNLTFKALYELSQENYEGKPYFNAQEIYLRRNVFDQNLPDNFKKKIHNDIYEIRNFILKTFQQNNLFIDVRDLIESVKDEDEIESFYKINADLPVNDEEDDIIENTYNVLILQDSLVIRNKIAELLNKLPDVGEIESSFSKSDVLQMNFLPDFICIDFENIGYITEIRKKLSNHKFGILVTATKKEKGERELVQQAIDLDIPLKNFISLAEKDWEKDLITKFSNEKQRIFYKKIVSSERDFKLPLIEILPESDLANGVLRLNVDNIFFKMNVSNISRILGYLLENPNKLIKLEKLKKEIFDNNSPVTKDEQTGWTKKIRDQIEAKWLKNKDRELAKKILDSSSDGLILNCQIIKNSSANLN